MTKLTILIIFIFIYNSSIISMEKKPYHHLPDGTFRNPEGSPKRDTNFKWSFKIFNQEKPKDMYDDIPKVVMPDPMPMPKIGMSASP